MDKTGKIKFTMETANDTDLEFLDFKLKIVEGKIRADIFDKTTNSFIYSTTNICYPKKDICNIPKGIVLTLKIICDDDTTFGK